MKNLRQIHVIVKYFYPVAAGIETNVLEIYSVLAKKGWDVTIHTSLDTLTEKNCLSKEEIIRGLKVKRYPYRWYGYFPFLDWQTADLVCFHNFNVSHFPLMAYAGILKLLGRKHFSVVVVPHGGFNPEWSIYPWLMVLLKKTYHYTIGTFLMNTVVDKIRAVSEWERRQIISKGVRENKVMTISNGIENEAYMDVDKFASAEIKKEVKKLGRYLIQIGRVYPIKNYETTIRALVKLPKDVKYVIVGPVGDQGYFDNLKKLIKNLGLEKRVIFLGVIRGIDKYYLIKHAAIMVHMAIWESFCNVVHEGMSQGLVCIVADNTALKLLVKEDVNGYRIPTRNSQKLAEKINSVLMNSTAFEIKRIKENNIRFAKEHSWKSVAMKVNSLYQ